MGLILGGVSSVAQFISVHEEIQLNRVCCSHFCGVFLVFKGSNYLELINSY